MRAGPSRRRSVGARGGAPGPVLRSGVARFEPFAGIRYDPTAEGLEAVLAPPYDVVDEEERARLVALDPHNAIRLELPVDEGGRNRYAVAAALLEEWLAEGALVADAEPAFYVYRMGFTDEAGRPRQTTGVVGALGLGDDDVLPHERTMPKPKSDRLDLLRATRTNSSPIWGLSLAAGWSALCDVPGPPDARASVDGVHHRLWRVTQPGVVGTVSDAVASAPVVVADGHHRYETALAYRAERRAATADAPGAYDAIMALVVELAPDQLDVRPYHRLLSGLPAGTDPVEVLAGAFAVEPGPDARADGGAALAARMAEVGALGLVTVEGAFLLRPRPETDAAAEEDLDSSRLDVALAAAPARELAYEHARTAALRAVADGRAQAAVLVRPATVAQIAEVAHAQRLMPPTTTFFHPKPRTGLVFRRLD